MKVEIGVRDIKQLREVFGMSQRELGIKMGISRATLSQIELGVRKLQFRDAFLLCKIFSISIDDLGDLEPFKSSLTFTSQPTG